LKRRIYQLDVFTKKAYAGNPLAVVIDGDGISQQRMQAVAREMNLAETVFVQKPTSVRALARLRIFTTKEELPLAGHPVIGTWFLLAQLGVVPAQKGSVRILQQTGAGVLPVEIAFREGKPQQVTMTQKPGTFRTLRGSRARLASALGLKAQDFHPSLPVESVSTGIPNVIVPLKNRRTLAKIRMNTAELYDLIRGQGTMAYCFALGANGTAFSRGMLPWEIYEDPATGSAGGSLGAYLVHHEQLKPGARLRILQGVEMGRPSHIVVQVSEENGNLVPRVRGAAITILEGILEA
jgi:trans-2,3-dihydro-3-hydroxyanthranilate isomerase